MPLFVKGRSFLRNLFLPRRVEVDLDQEVQSHLEMLTEENIRAGMPPKEAQRVARMELGGIEQVKEQVREERIGNWLHSLISDCRYGVRQLRKNPGFTAVAILTLALGIGANTGVFSILNAVLLRALPYPYAERLVKAGAYDLKSGTLYGTTSYPDFADWSAQNRFFASFAAYEDKTFNLGGTFQPEHVKGEIVSSDFFETFGVQPDKGQSFASAHNQQAVVLSHSLWSRSFGSNPLVIGMSITLDGYGYEVAGVMPPSFQFPDSETELWVLITPLRPDFREEITTRGNLGFSVVGRLKPNVTLSQAQAGMAVIAHGLQQQYPDSNR